MKLGIFTDPHYSSVDIPEWERYNSRSLDKIKTAMDAFTAANCDLVICMGDLIDHEKSHALESENLARIATVLNRYDLPFVAIMGNHDAFSFEQDEYYQILGTQRRPENRVIDGKTLLFLDACHFKTGIHYHPGDEAQNEEAWTDTYYPYPKHLKAALEMADAPVFVFLHQNIDPNCPEDHRLSNDLLLRSILAQSSKVDTVFQGHYHEGKQSMIDGIRYITFPSMCAADDRYFIVEI